jgi:hypothetical protein
MDPGAEFKGQVRDRRSAVVAAALPLLLAAVIGINLLPSDHDTSVPNLDSTASPSPETAAPTVAVQPSEVADQSVQYVPIDAGPYEVPWSGGTVRLEVPAGWSVARPVGWCGQARPLECLPPQGGTTLTRYPLQGDEILTLSIDHDVQHLLGHSCRDSLSAGSTALDLMAAIMDWDSTGGFVSDVDEPVIGGFPAFRLSIGMTADFQGCRQLVGGAGSVWSNRSSDGFSIPENGTGTVYLIDVNGRRLVLTSLELGPPRGAVDGLDAMIASMAIDASVTATAPPETVFIPDGPGRHGFTVAGIPMSIELPADELTGTGWSSNGDFLVSKSIAGPQGAEAAILWTTFPGGAYPAPCFDVLAREAAASAADLAAAVSRAPADPLAVIGPTPATVGGRPAQHVAFTVGDDHGCNPGFFFRWPDIYGGALWGGVSRGDIISTWIVDVDGTLLFIEGLATTQATPKLELELQGIVDSIRFEDTG